VMASVAVSRTPGERQEREDRGVRAANAGKEAGALTGLHTSCTRNGRMLLSRQTVPATGSYGGIHLMDSVTQSPDTVTRHILPLWP
jgi:hypothetical protein